jgi:aspartate 1-decarboxylase
MVLRTYLAGKIHRIRLTDKNIEYQGSITLGRDCLAAAGISPHEAVQVVNITTGARLMTYVICSEDAGICVLNGGAARLAEVGDHLIIMAFAQSTEPLHPRIVLVDSQNRVQEILNGEVQTASNPWDC